MLVRRLGDCEEIIANDGCRLREVLHPERGVPGISYSLAVAVVDPGQRTLRHYLDGQTEVYFITRGTGTMHIGAEARDVGVGDAIVIPSGAEQWIECTGDEPLEFLAIVSPPWNAESDVRCE